MNAPVATDRKSFLPMRLRSTTAVGSSSISTASRSTTSVTTPMPLAMQNDTKSSLTVGDRVLVNGLKNGILRYIGTVQFAQGLFCGVELDEPDGKHNGQVNNIRYFQCKTNHGIFVPHDKVVLASQERASSSQRPISRLKPPTIKRSMTLASSSSINSKIEQIPIKTSLTSIQLPDIIPSSSTSIQPISIIETINDHDMTTSTERIKSIIEPIIESQTSIPDEQIIEADFTDSVSLILHHLQQEQKPILIQPCHSITISEEDTIDDNDEIDNESITESIISENMPIIRRLSSTIDSTKSVQTDLSFDLNENITIIKNNLLNSKTLSNSNKSLTNSTTSINKRKQSIPTPNPIGKKNSERKSSIQLTNPSTTSRKSSLIPPKHGLSSMTKVNSTKSITSLGSQSKLNQSLSSSNSVNSSHSDLTSNQQKPPKIIPKSTRTVSHSIDLSSNKKLTSSRHSLDVHDHQLIIQKVLIQTLENTNEQLKKQYQYLLNQFELMYILTQYYITENDNIHQKYQLKISKIRIINNQLKILIEQLKLSHQNQLITLDKEYENQIYTINQTHKKEFIEYQQEINKLFNEKIQFEIHCKSLQNEVDRFMNEMINSEHADPLLRRVEILEKDNTSLQTVLEMKNQELTQLRTKINEQIFQREDQIALQKRIDMAENRNQDLVCLLRNWQLNEKLIAVERDQLKEQIIQLERDNHQLTFENETLLYRLHQRLFTPILKLNLNSYSKKIIRNRAHSFSSIRINTNKNQCLTRSLSLNCILNR